MSKIIYYDLETTGVLFDKNAIHQISGRIEIDGVAKEDFNFKLKPIKGKVIEAEALAIGGITEEDLNSELYEDPKVVYSRLNQMLAKYVSRYDRQDKFHLCGFNNRGFDDKFLRQFFEDNNDKYFGSYFWSDSLDVMVLASQHLIGVRSQMPNFKLMSVARQLGIDVIDESLHDAMYDIDLTISIYKIVTAKVA